VPVNQIKDYLCQREDNKDEETAYHIQQENTFVQVHILECVEKQKGVESKLMVRLLL
jgi:hypothetical protein